MIRYRTERERQAHLAARREADEQNRVGDTFLASRWVAAGGCALMPTTADGYCEPLNFRFGKTTILRGARQ